MPPCHAGFLEFVMKWIYLSPHLDDAVYSCGGLIHQQVQQGIDVEIWTVFAGQFDAANLTPFAKDIHQRWGTGLESITLRKAEDQEACTLLGVNTSYFDFQDVIYRFKPETSQAEIIENDDLFREYHPGDNALMESITQVVRQAALRMQQIQLCIPLGLGNHIDHQIVRRSAEALIDSYPILYYADFPYVIRSQAQPDGLQQRQFALSEADVEIWCQAVAIYKSQISTFWDDEAQICEEIFPYWKKGGGSCLWFHEQ
ncbi:MAG: PIG-L family deacetylase [Anaerolineaceae bacterium]|nr:PIG-L family deacetylase [Anaerolineaceae bacterium]